MKKHSIRQSKKHFHFLLKQRFQVVFRFPVNEESSLSIQKNHLYVFQVKSTHKKTFKTSFLLVPKLQIPWCEINRNKTHQVVISKQLARFQNNQTSHLSTREIKILCHRDFLTSKEKISFLNILKTFLKSHKSFARELSTHENLVKFLYKQKILSDQFLPNSQRQAKI